MKYNNRKTHFSAILLMAVGCGLVIGCGSGWQEEEKQLLESQPMVLHVLSIDNPQENEDLRSKSESVTDAMVSDKTYSMLAAKLLATVQAPEYDGVGITAFNGEMIPGPEGCLSVPEKRGQVERYRDIEISYISPHTLKDTTERVTGFTAVIFQHECDHLDGIVYVDKGFDIKDIDE